MTTWNESFNTADSTTLGPDQTWTESLGDLQVVSNQCQIVTNNVRSRATFATGSVVDAKRMKATVTSYVTPSVGGTSDLRLYTAGTEQHGGGINLSATTCTLNVFQGGSNTTQKTITKPTVPFDLEVTMSARVIKVYINGVFQMAGSITAPTTADMGIEMNTWTAATDVAVDSIQASDVGTLPTTLPSPFAWPVDGIAYLGPFISSAGNVYVLGRDSATAQGTFWKATDPTVSFTKDSLSGLSVSYSVAAHQVGDMLHVAAASSSAVYYTTLNLATDTWAGNLIVAAPASPWAVNAGCAVVKRSTGGDVIVFYNTAGVTNMGKTYSRIAARRSAGGTAAFGAETTIDIAPITTTQQSESVDCAVLGTSDRIHLFWTIGNGTAGQPSNALQRTVKSTDNLNGTQPATAGQNLGTSRGAGAIDQSFHSSGQAFCSAAGVLALPYATSGSNAATYTATDADAPTWATTTASGAPVAVTASGATAIHSKLGGAPFDVDDQYLTWIDSGSSDPMYDDKPSGGAFGTDVTIVNTTATQISSNIFQRGTNMVLATIYDVAGTWVYDEVFLRTAVTPDATATPPATAVTTTRNTPNGGAGGTPAAATPVATSNPATGSSAVSATAQPAAFGVTVTRNTPTGSVVATTTQVATPTVVRNTPGGGVAHAATPSTPVVLAQTPSTVTGGTPAPATPIVTRNTPAGGAGGTTTQLVVTATANQASATAGGTSATAQPAAGLVTVTTLTPGGAVTVTTTQVVQAVVTSSTPLGGAGGTPAQLVVLALAQTSTGSGSTAGTGQPSATQVLVTRSTPLGGAGGTPNALAVLVTMLTPSGAAGLDGLAQPASKPVVVFPLASTSSVGGTAPPALVTVTRNAPFGSAGGVTSQLVVTALAQTPTGFGTTGGTGIAGQLAAVVTSLTPLGGVSAPSSVTTPTVTRNVALGGAGGTPATLVVVATSNAPTLIGSTPGTGLPAAVAAIVTRNAATGGISTTAGGLVVVATSNAPTGAAATNGTAQPVARLVTVTTLTPNSVAGGMPAPKAVIVTMNVPGGAVRVTVAPFTPIVTVPTPTAALVGVALLKAVGVNMLAPKGGAGGRAGVTPVVVFFGQAKGTGLVVFLFRSRAYVGHDLGSSVEVASEPSSDVHVDHGARSRVEIGVR